MCKGFENESSIELDKQDEKHEADYHRVQSATIDAINGDHHSLDLITDSELADDANWAKFRHGLVKHVDGRLSLVERVELADMVIECTIKYAKECAERELD